MTPLSRRRFLQVGAASTAALALAPRATVAADDPPQFTLPKLPYAYDALEPHIDAETMKIHHDLHHKAYVDNLNKALAKFPEFLKMQPGELLANVSKLPTPGRQAVINNGGGHYNHSMFWTIMGPKGGGSPSGDLAQAIDKDLGGFDKMQKDLSQAALTRFGSGWGWVTFNQGKLAIQSTGNQDCPLMKGTPVVFGIDVWEHAYYLKYRNKRADYIKAWWNVVNWDAVSDRFKKAKAQG